MGISSAAVAAVYTSGDHDGTAATGFFANHTTATGFCEISYYWDPEAGSTEDQFKVAYKHRETGASEEIYNGDGHDYSRGVYFNANVDAWGSLEHYHYDPASWGWQYRNSWAYVTREF